MQHLKKIGPTRADSNGNDRARAIISDGNGFAIFKTSAFNCTSSILYIVLKNSCYYKRVYNSQLLSSPYVEEHVGEVLGHVAGLQRARFLRRRRDED